MKKQQKNEISRESRKRNKIFCFGCETLMDNKTKEHVFPKWLIKRTSAHWVRRDYFFDEIKPKIGSSSYTIPLCRSCNNKLGIELESPVQLAFDDAEKERGLSDYQAELLVRWLWKFEAWIWGHHYSSSAHFDANQTPLARLLGEGFEPMRKKLTFSYALCDGDVAYDEDGNEVGLPMGVDTPVTKHDATCVMGVFCRLALGVSLRWADSQLPKKMKIYHFPPLSYVADRNQKTIFPEVGFPTYTEAVTTLSEQGTAIKLQHEALAFP